MVLVGLKMNAVFGQMPPDLSISLETLGLIVVVDKYSVHLELMGELGNGLSGACELDDQTRLQVARCVLDGRIQRMERLDDELDASIGPGEVVQDVFVQYKYSVEFFAILECKKQGFVVLEP